MYPFDFHQKEPGELQKIKKYNKTIYNNQHEEPYPILEFMGVISGGDRCTGSFISATFKKDQIWIKEYQGKTPLDCGPQDIKEFSIPLNKFN